MKLKYKNLLILAVSGLPMTILAQGISAPVFIADQCAKGSSATNCTMKQWKPGDSYGSSGSSASSAASSAAADAARAAAFAAAGAGVNELLASGAGSVAGLLIPKNVQGSYNSRVPGGNPFVFCSGGRPSRRNPLRVVYDQICPAGNKSPTQVMQENGLTDHVSDAQALTGTLAKLGTSALVGIGVSNAASQILNSSSDSVGQTTNIGNNMSFNDYNRQFYNQITQEDYQRQMEYWKAQQDPNYIPKEIPSSGNFQLNQTGILTQQAEIMNQFNDSINKSLENLPPVAPTLPAKANAVETQVSRNVTTSNNSAKSSNAANSAFK